MRYRILLPGLVAFGALLIPATANASVSAGPNAVPAATTSTCGTGSSSGNVRTCLVITSGSPNILTASAKVLNAKRTLNVCLRGPNGSLGCSGLAAVVVNQILTFSAELNSISGTYCANTYRQNSDGSSTQIGHECHTV